MGGHFSTMWGKEVGRPELTMKQFVDSATLYDPWEKPATDPHKQWRDDQPIIGYVPGSHLPPTLREQMAADDMVEAPSIMRSEDDPEMQNFDYFHDLLRTWNCPYHKKRFIAEPNQECIQKALKSGLTEFTYGNILWASEMGVLYDQDHPSNPEGHLPTFKEINGLTKKLKKTMKGRILTSDGTIFDADMDNELTELMKDPEKFKDMLMTAPDYLDQVAKFLKEKQFESLLKPGDIPETIVKDGKEYSLVFNVSTGKMKICDNRDCCLRSHCIYKFWELNRDLEIPVKDNWASRSFYELLNVPLYSCDNKDDLCVLCGNQ